MISAARFSPAELAAATGGAWRPAPPSTATLGLYSDSREAGEGGLFFAFRGETFDGHQFLAAAAANGAAAVCVAADQTASLPAALPALVVGDPLAAYQALARFHRQRFPLLRLAAVTGSVGKTSVKEMLRAVFAAAAGSEEAVLATADNTNNYFGVPQNLLKLEPKHRYAVIEMGTNHSGEISPLARMAEPQAALVNSIAACHLEFLGSLIGVAEEKAHIFDGLDPNGAAVIPADGPELELLAARAAAFRTFRFGSRPGAEVWAEYLIGDLEKSRFVLHFASGESVTVEWALNGCHQARNAAAAAAVARAFGIEPAVIAAGLARTVIPGMRMNRSVIDEVVCINDAYNANPESMAAALRHLAELRAGDRLIVILGDMLELGPAEAEAHLSALRLAHTLLPEAVLIAVGPRFRAAANEVSFPVESAADADEAEIRLEQHWRPGRIVFLKGSRGMKLETTLEKRREG